MRFASLMNSRVMESMNKDAKLYVAGHRGLVGSAIVRALRNAGYSNIVTVDKKQVDLLDQQAVATFFAREKPEYVFLAAAKVGGIVANSQYPADFIYENLTIQSHIIHESYRNNVSKSLLLRQFLHLSEAGGAYL